jgi:aminoglycoside phosphotransferase (APT) family kinase protein
MASTQAAFVTSRTAEVFALSDTVVLKLFHAGANEEAAREASIAELVQTTGVQCPAVLGRTERDGRAGIIYTRLHGQALARWLGLKRPWRIHAAGRILAQAHADLHRFDAPDLPSLRGRLQMDIESAVGISMRSRSLALQALRMMPDSHILCHGDLTTDNILLTASGPIVIDWSEAAYGDPAADVARSLVHLVLAHKYYLSASRRPLAQRMHAWLSAAYMRQYRYLQPETAKRVPYWLLPVAVARVSRGAPISRTLLLNWVAQLTAHAPPL